MYSDSDSSEDEMLILWYLVNQQRSATSKHRKTKRRHRVWINEKLMESRREYGVAYFMKELISTEDRIYQNLHVAAVDFQEIQELVRDDIRKMTCTRKEAFAPELRLATTLRWLRCGLTEKDLANQLGLGQTTCHVMISEVCEAIVKKLWPVAMQNCNPEDLLESGRKFEANWNFPNCFGALEGLHVQVRPAKDANIRNYVEKSSVVLFTLVDSSYCLLAADVVPGDQKLVEDFQMSLLDNMIPEDSIPPPKLLPQSGIFLPHIVVAGDSFPHTKYLMTPYTSETLEQSPEKGIFNARHLQAMSVATDAIGLMVQRFRVFTKSSFNVYDFTTTVLKACCCLHNFLRRRDIERDNGQFDVGQVREALLKANFIPLPSHFRVSSTIAQEVRENFLKHFLSEMQNSSKPVVPEVKKESSAVEEKDSCIVNMKIEVKIEPDGLIFSTTNH